jgi:hypothetical protein
MGSCMKADILRLCGACYFGSLDRSRFHLQTPEFDQFTMRQTGFDARAAVLHYHTESQAAQLLRRA